MLLWLLACTTDPCPSGWLQDRARVARIEALLDRSIDAPVCWGRVPERGLRDSEGRFLLDRDGEDPLLAARVVHLEHHTARTTGPGCLDRLLVEEANGWAAELRQREVFGVSDPSGPAESALGPHPSRSDLMAWLAESNDPVPVRLRASHRARCEGGSVAPPEVR